MERAFTDTIVQSSQIDDNDSSEIEESPLKLSTSQVENLLNKIPTWNTEKNPVPGVSYSENKVTNSIFIAKFFNLSEFKFLFILIKFNLYKSLIIQLSLYENFFNSINKFNFQSVLTELKEK